MAKGRRRAMKRAMQQPRKNAGSRNRKKRSAKGKKVTGTVGLAQPKTKQMIIIIILPVHDRDGADDRAKHLTVAATWKITEARAHLQALQNSRRTYVLTTGRMLTTC